MVMVINATDQQTETGNRNDSTLLSHSVLNQVVTGINSVPDSYNARKLGLETMTIKSLFNLGSKK